MKDAKALLDLGRHYARRCGWWRRLTRRSRRAWAGRSFMPASPSCA